MTMPAPTSFTMWRRLPLVWLLAAFALVGMALTPPAIRAAVFARNAEQGVTRFYEIETHAPTPDLTPRAATIRLGYKPSRTPARAESAAVRHAERPSALPLRPRAGPRAPPHQPRAPPTLS